MERVVVRTLLVLVLLAVTAQSCTRSGPAPVPRDECRACHSAVLGLESAHASLGCAACHLGDPLAVDARLAHAGLIRIPGNAADMDHTCGSASCHASLPPRLRNNIMSTMNGVVSVDRWVFGEQPTPTAKTPVTELGFSPADTHLRNLCASCHLGNPKTEPGPLTERSRGGGCNACHLRYSAAARASLADLKKLEPSRPFVHAALSVKPEPIACFGCHSRSGRVSLNFEGWQEFSGDAGTAALRTLEDGRVVKRGLGDLHAERGMGCVDCHGSWEVMGDGTLALHREAQSTLRCTDCHLTAAPVTRTLAELDGESMKVASLEGFASPGRRYLTIARSGVALINTFVADGGVFLTGKYSGRTAAMTSCSRGPGHADVSCSSCHDAWVPQCVSCHTRFEADGGMYDLLTHEQAEGDWQEEGGAPLADRAPLGVRLLDGGARRIEEFAPGMVMTLSPMPDKKTFHRLFAPAFAHTIRRESRSCVDCHASSLALGYGRGTLKYQSRRWKFTPQFPLRPEDGLPEDAWVGFLQTRGIDSTTREDTRPFTVEEQRKMLTVGTCLTCHASDSAPMRRGLEDFAAVLKRRSPRCSPR